MKSAHGASLSQAQATPGMDIPTRAFRHDLTNSDARMTSPLVQLLRSVAATGYRFTTTDESSYLQPYQTGNVQLMYSLPVHGRQWQFTAQCNNIWNEQYQVVASRPMPGVNWLAGFNADLF